MHSTFPTHFTLCFFHQPNVFGKQWKVTWPVVMKIFFFPIHLKLPGSIITETKSVVWGLQVQCGGALAHCFSTFQRVTGAEICTHMKHVLYLVFKLSPCSKCNLFLFG